MFKFIKDMISAVKEGVAEGKEELKQEAAAKAAQEEANKVDLTTIPHAESFGTAIGAPFRAVIFGDWFSLFGSKDDDEKYPAHYYTFVNYPAHAEKKAELEKALQRDFGISNNEEAHDTLGYFFDIAGIDPDAEDADEDIEPMADDMWDTSKPGAKALISAVMSHIVTGSADVGHLEKEEALELLSPIADYVRKHYNNWQEFGDDFLVGDKSIGLNNAVGHKVLNKYIGYLKEKKGSPWNNVAWNP